MGKIINGPNVKPVKIDHSKRNLGDGFIYITVGTIVQIACAWFSSILFEKNKILSETYQDSKSVSTFFWVGILVGLIFYILGIYLIIFYKRVKPFQPKTFLVTAFLLVPGVVISIVAMKEHKWSDYLIMILVALVSLLIARNLDPKESTNQNI